MQKNYLSKEIQGRLTTYSTLLTAYNAGNLSEDKQKTLILQAISLHNFWHHNEKGVAIEEAEGKIKIHVDGVEYFINEKQTAENGKTIVFICNGEIYNFKDLIKDFQLPIKNNSDCLTIPNLYIKTEFNMFVELFKYKIKGEFAFILLEFDKLL